VIDPVVEVACTTRRIELEAPIVVGTSTIAERDYALVEITTASGAVGRAYGLTRTLPIAELASELAAAHVIGNDADAVIARYRSLHGATRLGGRSGAVAKAIGLIDVALWDAKAVRLGVPLWRLLGGVSRTNPAMIVAAYPDPARQIEELVEQVLAYTREGYRLLKIERDPDPDRMSEWVRALSEALPVGAELVIDCGSVFEHPHEAAREIASWSAAPIAWVEDPFVPEDAAAYAALRRRVDVPIGAGDEMGDLRGLFRLAFSTAVDVLRVDVACVGVTGALHAAAVAQAADVRTSYHVYPEVAAHLAAARGDGAIVESFDPRGNRYDPTYMLVEGGSVVAGGQVSANESPGLGFRFLPAGEVS
jgi:L-alanine-DL-glutamate epimerase-like enolase superfamily enzyme